MPVCGQDFQSAQTILSVAAKALVAAAGAALPVVAINL